MSDMEADHVIAKTLPPAVIAQSKIDHGLPHNFDLESLFNLVPAHAACNNSKSNKVLPDTPAISLLFQDASAKEPLVRKSMNQMAGDKAIGHALAVFEDLSPGAMSPMQLDRLRAAARDLEMLSMQLLGLRPANLHPLIQALPPEGSWRIVETLKTGQAVAVVSDGLREGVTGSHESWMCPNGHNGPWNGIKCLTCGAMVPPDRD